MTDTAWKAFERLVATSIGGTRTWWKEADVVSDKLVVECKRRELPAWLHDAVNQAKRNARMHTERLPAVALKHPGMHGYLMVMHSKDWHDWFGDLVCQEDE